MTGEVNNCKVHCDYDSTAKMPPVRMKTLYKPIHVAY